jgi:[ribosomal protein S5]-alanine N-acetyltransferase
MDQSKYFLHSERLAFRKFDFDDADFIIELLNSPGWLRFIGDRKVRNQSQAIQYLEQGPMKSYSEYGFGLWMVLLIENETPIGMCGLLKRDYLEHPDIGFALLPAFARKGYGKEMAGAVLLYSLEKLTMSRICAISLEENTASIRVLEHLGMQYVKQIQSQTNSEELLQLYATPNPQEF